MKRLTSLWICLLLAAAALAGCSRPAAAQPEVDEGELRIVSTIFPGYDFAREIASDNALVTMLLPPGSESHSYEPSPQDILSIQNCDLFIYVGGDGDTWVDGILESIDTSDITVLSMMDQVQVVNEEIREGMEDKHADHEYDAPDHSGSEDAHTGHGADEHVWTSPANAIQISGAIAAALCERDAENAETYQANLETYRTELQTLDADLRAVTESAARRTIIFGDRFPFRYLADEYGLEYYAAFPGCSTETEASAKTVAFLIDKVRQESIPVVFHIEFSNEKMADTICGSTGANKRLLHSCHNVSRADMDSGVSYLSLMYANIESLKEALQ